MKYQNAKKVWVEREFYQLTNLVVLVRVDVGLRVLPRGPLPVLQPPERRHHGVVVAVSRPGPDGQLAQVGAGVVHDGLVHVVPEAGGTSNSL